MKTGKQRGGVQDAERLISHRKQLELTTRRVTDSQTSRAAVSLLCSRFLLQTEVNVEMSESDTAVFVTTNQFASQRYLQGSCVTLHR